MAKRPPLSKAATEVAPIVWDLKGATVRDVLEALPDGREVEYKTVQTYLRRLEAKGYLRSQPRGRSSWYTPRVRPMQVIKATVDVFVRRLFDGEPVPLVEHLIRDAQLNPADIGRLRALLKELEKKRDDS